MELRRGLLGKDFRVVREERRRPDASEVMRLRADAEYQAYEPEAYYV